MNVLALVLAGHFIGDWIVQTDWQAANKVWTGPSSPLTEAGYRLSWKANQQHMLGYHLTLMVLVAPVWHSWAALGGLGISWVTHSIIDRRWPVCWLMAHTGSKPFSETTFGVIAVDQALHLSILCLLVAVAG